MSQELDLKKIDKNMDFDHNTADGMDWYTIDDAPFALDGLYWYTPGKQFRRLPEDVHVSEGVDYLAWHTAGVMARFCSDADEIRVNVKITHATPSDHMTMTCRSGFDLYVGSGTSKVYSKTTRFDFSKLEYIATVFGPAQKKKMREFTLHFPLYSHPEKLLIGVTTGAKILPPSPWRDPRPVVVYGTSIQQGGCASRPGMCHTNIMSRMLNRPFINLGFSGSGRGEPAAAEAIAEIEDPAAIVLDYDANAGEVGLRNTLSNFLDILRKKHPVTPILLVSRLPYASEFSDEDDCLEYRQQVTEIHLNELGRRREAGDKNIHFLDGSTLYGEAPSECTVDGAHATDLGFYQIARRMAPVIDRIINEAQER